MSPPEHILIPFGLFFSVLLLLEIICNRKKKLEVALWQLQQSGSNVGAMVLCLEHLSGNLVAGGLKPKTFRIQVGVLNHQATAAPPA